MKIALAALLALTPVSAVASPIYNDSQPGYSNQRSCFKTEYREEYIPGSKSSQGYIKSYEVEVVIPCGGQSKAERIDDNDCSEGSFIGGILGAGIALTSSRGKDRFWAVPAGGTAGALIGCQLDGG